MLRFKNFNFEYQLKEKVLIFLSFTIKRFVLIFGGFNIEYKKVLEVLPLPSIKATRLATCLKYRILSII